MTYHVVVACNDKPIKSYTADFIPRIGDTIIGKDLIPLIVTEVIYDIPDNNQDFMAVVINTKWR